MSEVAYYIKIKITYYLLAIEVMAHSNNNQLMINHNLIFK